MKDENIESKFIAKTIPDIWLDYVVIVGTSNLTEITFDRAISRWTLRSEFGD